jgi:hypothetical protein
MRGGCGSNKALAAYCIFTLGAAASIIQKVYIVLAHTLCERIEAAMFTA